MNKNFDELKDWKDGVRRMLEQEMERLKERYEQINNDLKALEATEELVAELEKVLAAFISSRLSLFLKEGLCKNISTSCCNKVSTG